MPITEEILAQRLKQERIRLDLTQEEIADRLGIKRTSVVQIEGGKRAVSSIELAQLAGLYGRSAEFFLAETTDESDSGVLLLRANRDLNEPDLQSLDACAATCKAATELESVLGSKRADVSFSYTMDRPQSRWDAVEQGIRLAAMERKRLNLGVSPVRNIVEIIAQHGVWVGRHTLTTDISGMFFVGGDTGKAIIVNSGHHVTRRLFSYAHEYAHLLVDSRQTPSAISRFGSRDDLLEVRANTFSAHFLMPADGVREFLDVLGGPSRQVQEVFDGYKQEDINSDESLVLVQRRSTANALEVKMLDALRLARYFGTSYTATIYHLLNLKAIPKEIFEKLFSQKSQASQVNELLKYSTHLEQEEACDLKTMMKNLIMEGLLREEISIQKAHAYAKLIQVDPRDLDKLVSSTLF